MFIIFSIKSSSLTLLSSTSSLSFFIIIIAPSSEYFCHHIFVLPPSLLLLFLQYQNFFIHNINIFFLFPFVLDKDRNPVRNSEVIPNFLTIPPSFSVCASLESASATF
jgi:hypothetical protein